MLHGGMASQDGMQPAVQLKCVWPHGRQLGAPGWDRALGDGFGRVLCESSVDAPVRSLTMDRRPPVLILYVVHSIQFCLTFLVAVTAVHRHSGSKAAFRLQQDSYITNLSTG